MLPLVALVGRPNVGKSTIFNALTRTRDALVHDQPGVTRDRNYGVCRLDEDNHFLVVDTGGIAGEDEGLAGATTRQARALSSTVLTRRCCDSYWAWPTCCRRFCTFLSSTPSKGMLMKDSRVSCQFR